MKKIALFVLPALIAGLVGCSKSNSSTPSPNPNPTAGPTPFSPSVSNVHGTMIALIMNYTYSNSQIPIPVSVETESGIASFFSGAGSSTLVDAGAVTLNTVALEKQSNNSYLKLVPPGQTPSFNLSDGADWSVAGAGSIPAINYSHSGGFPNYTDSLPGSITKSSGLTINLSSASNADSIYVMVAAGDKYVLKSVGGSASSVTLSASDLSVLPNVSDNTAFLEVCPVTFKVETIDGKNFAFIKERAVVRGVNIN